MALEIFSARRGALIVAFFFSIPCQGAAPARGTRPYAPSQRRAVTDEAEQTKELGRFEAYFNGIQTLKTVLVQVSPKGVRKTGTLYLQRPGRMRLVYDPVGSIELIADGQWLFQHDRRSKETNQIALSDTPMFFLLQPRVAFRQQTKIHHVIRAPQWSQVVVSSKSDPEAGSVVLQFAENPLRLTGWILRDADGRQTTVNLSGIQTNVSLPPQTFRAVTSDMKRNAKRRH